MHPWIDRKRLWTLLSTARPWDRAARSVEITLITLILLNVLEVMLSSVPAISLRDAPYLYLFEAFSVAVFTIEYLARLWSCTADPASASPVLGRLRFFIRPITLIDLMAIVPFYLPFFGVDLRIVRLFRLLRVLRILKLGRYSTAFQSIGRAISSKQEELAMTGIILVVLLLVSASLMYFAEHDAQPERFSSIPETLWWSVITLTTVGYGDIYPVTTAGKIIAGIISILGIGMVALPAGIISASFVEEIAKDKEQGSTDRGDACPLCGRRYDAK